MTEHPLTPPSELVQQWRDRWSTDAPPNSSLYQWLATQAARWGSDQELEACCEWLERNFDDWDTRFSVELRTARRPKPPSLKEQALEALKHAPGPDYPNPITLLTADEHALIRRALQALDD